MRISGAIDPSDDQLELRLEDVVNDDAGAEDDMGSNIDIHDPAHSQTQHNPHSQPIGQAPDAAVQQLFDHAALEAQINDLLTEAVRPASRAAAAAAAARQRNTTTRTNPASDPRSATTADAASMSYPLSLAAAQSYPLPPPPGPLGYPPQEPESTEARGPESHHPTEPPPVVAGVLDGHAPQPQNFADITDILAHLSAHLENAAAAAAAAANPPHESSGAEDDEDSAHEGREEDEEEDIQQIEVPAPPEVEEDLTRPFVCDVPICGKAFGRKSDLARHLRIHSGERPYPCDEPGCGKSFIQRSALNVHKRVHTGEKPHTCEFAGCDKTFGDSSSLARHRRTHTGRRPYKCDDPLCDKTFTRRTTLNRHMRVHMPGFDPQRPTKRRRTDDELADMPTIGSFITPRAALPGGVRPVPQMSHSTMVSLGSAGPSTQPEGSGQPPVGSDPNQINNPWGEQANGNSRPHSSNSTPGHGVPRGNTGMEEWVREITRDGEPEPEPEPGSGNSQRDDGQTTPGGSRLPPPSIISY